MSYQEDLKSYSLIDERKIYHRSQAFWVEGVLGLKYKFLLVA